MVFALVGAACGGEPEPPVPADAPVALSPEQLESRRKEIVGAVKTLVGDLAASGRYDCCVEGPCQQCAMRMGGCKCGESARRGEPVCEECALMWRQGRGAEPGVDAAGVRSYLEAAREAEDRAAGRCACAEGGAAPGR